MPTALVETISIDREGGGGGGLVQCLSEVRAHPAIGPDRTESRQGRARKVLVGCKEAKWQGGCWVSGHSPGQGVAVEE